MHQSTSPLSAQPPSHPPRSRQRAIRPVGLLVALAMVLTTAMAAPSTASASAGATVQTVSFDVATVDRRLSQTFRNRLMRISRSKRGAPYRYGAAGPHRFDCSGFTSWVYRKAGRRIPRTSRQQAGAARRISARNRRRGDLVFFHSGGRVYHVGIYAGRGHIWHSPSTGKRVSRQRIWTRSHFYGRPR